MAWFHPSHKKTLTAAAFLGLAAGSWGIAQNQVPPGSPRIGFAPIGTPFGSSAAYSYLAGKPVIRLPSGVTIDPYNTGAGYTMYDPAEQQRMQQERYQVQSAQAAEAYRQSMAMRQKAMEQSQAEAQARAVRRSFDPKTGKPRNAAKADAPAPVFDDGGKPIWPEYAVKNPKRTQADDAIAAVQAEVKANGSASVATVVQAKQALRAYGLPALKAVPGGSRVLSERLREHLIRMDQALDAFAEPPAAAAEGDAEKK